MQKKGKRGRRRFTLLMAMVLLISQICATNMVVLANEESATVSNYSEGTDKTEDTISNDSDSNSGESSDANSGNDSGNDSVEGSDANSGDDSGNDSVEGSDANSGDDLGNDSVEGSDANSGDDSGNDSGEGSDANSGDDSGNDSGEGSDTNLEDNSGDNSGEGSDANLEEEKVPENELQKCICKERCTKDAPNLDCPVCFDKDSYDEVCEGEEIEYTITEDEVMFYTATQNGYNEANTPEKTQVSGSKTWDDNNNQDGKRPASITINLLADGEKVASKVVTAEDNWTWTFENLDKYKDGEEIEYTITEDEVPEYKAEVDGYDVTNIHIPDKISVNGRKTWNDNNDQDGLRPTSITIRLYANGKEVQQKVVQEADNWTWNFTNLDKYAGGEEIVYTIKEDFVYGYSAEYDGYNITNTHTPEKTYVSGSKTWNDADNQDGKRPASITINLLADGEKVQSKIVTAEDNWTFKFEDLDKYADGEEIEYTITEDEVAYYTTQINGTRVTNTHKPEKTVVEGKKTWVADKYGHEAIPESITIRLYAGTEEVASKVVTAEDNWSWKFENLDKYKNGQEIVYTIKEDSVTDYSTEYDGYNVTNTYTPNYTQMSVVKVWDDNNNQDGIRPEAIKVRLYDGLFPKGEVVELNEDNNWSYTWSNLPDSRFGFKINYSVKEIDKVNGYEAKVVNGTLTTITNVHVPEKTYVSGSKTWNDNNNQDRKRPESITIRLYANGKEVASKVITEDDNWSWKFENLDKYKAGTEIVYTITEDVVEGYTTVINGYNVTNNYTPGITSRTVKKVWNDEGNKDNIRPESIRVQLYADGEVCDDEVILNEANGWTYTWNNLVEKNKGKLILYTVSEIGTVDGYTTTYSEDTFVITNTHTPKPPKKTTPNDEPTSTPKEDSTHEESSTLEQSAVDEQNSEVTPANSEETTLTKSNVPKTGEDGTVLYACMFTLVICIILLIVLRKKK